MTGALRVHEDHRNLYHNPRNPRGGLFQTTWRQPPSAVQVERSSTGSCWQQNSGAPLRLDSRGRLSPGGLESLHAKRMGASKDDTIQLRHCGSNLTSMGSRVSSADGSHFHL